MKQLLAISWEMPPLSGPRAVQVTRLLVALGARGWHSRVVCFGPRSNRYQQDFDVSLESMSGGTATRIPVPSPEEAFLVRALWRLCPPAKRMPDEKRVWVPGAVQAARRALAERPADAIVSFAQPWSDHLVGLQLHRDTGLPWVAHFSDPWVDSPYQDGAAWQRRRLARMERAVIETASQVVFVNRQTADRVMAKYPSTWLAKTHVVPQGFVASDASPRQATTGPLRLVYTGRFYDGIRTPDVLFAALRALGEPERLATQIAIEIVGANMGRYERQARDLGLGAIVTFTGRVSPGGARERAMTADALLIIDAPAEGPSLFLPSKLIDYLPLRRPILGLTPASGPSVDLLGALGYSTADPRDVPAVTSALASLIDKHATGALAASPQHDRVAADYEIGATAVRFEAVLEAAVAPA